MKMIKHRRLKYYKRNKNIFNAYWRIRWTACKIVKPQYKNFHNFHDYFYHNFRFASWVHTLNVSFILYRRFCLFHPGQRKRRAEMAKQRSARSVSLLLAFACLNYVGKSYSVCLLHIYTSTLILDFFLLSNLLTNDV